MLSVYDNQGDGLSDFSDQLKKPRFDEKVATFINTHQSKWKSISNKSDRDPFEVPRSYEYQIPEPHEDIDFTASERLMFHSNSSYLEWLAKHEHPEEGDRFAKKRKYIPEGVPYADKELGIHYRSNPYNVFKKPYSGTVSSIRHNIQAVAERREEKKEEEDEEKRYKSKYMTPDAKPLDWSVPPPLSPPLPSPPPPTPTIDDTKMHTQSLIEDTEKDSTLDPRSALDQKMEVGETNDKKMTPQTSEEKIVELSKSMSADLQAVANQNKFNGRNVFDALKGKGKIFENAPYQKALEGDKIPTPFKGSSPKKICAMIVSAIQLDKKHDGKVNEQSLAKSIEDAITKFQNRKTKSNKRNWRVWARRTTPKKKGT